MPFAGVTRNRSVQPWKAWPVASGVWTELQGNIVNGHAGLEAATEFAQKIIFINLCRVFPIIVLLGIFRRVDHLGFVRDGIAAVETDAVSRR